MTRSIRYAIFMLLCIAPWTAAQSSPPAQPPATKPAAPPPTGSKVARDVEYAHVGDKSLVMDIYTPLKSAANMPVVVWIAGGAWRNTWTHDALPGGDAVGELVRHGYVVASISHRLSQDAVFPAQIEDCKGAIRFLRAGADKYGLDVDRIGVWGGSSGGHLAALLGTSAGAKELEGTIGGNLNFSSRVQCVVDCSGPTDMLKLDNSCAKLYKPPRLSPPAQLVGGPPAQHMDLVKMANPITYLTKNAPPFLIMHGDADNLVPIEQSQILVDALHKAGVDVTFEIIKGGGHGGSPAGQEQRLNRLTFDFFDKHLKPAATDKR